MNEMETQSDIVDKLIQVGTDEIGLNECTAQPLTSDDI